MKRVPCSVLAFVVGLGTVTARADAPTPEAPAPTPEAPAPAAAIAPDAEAVYEDERVAKVLVERGLHPDPSPAGKTLGKIHVVRHDVFVDDEFWPTFFNVFHARTHDEVVRRELLFAAGQPWDVARVEESIRNLRDLGIFTLVRIIPVVPEGGADTTGGTVDALVFTRDLWSLRAEMSIAVTGDLLNRFRIAGTERNVAGRNILSSISFDLLPRTFAIGELYNNRRLFGSRWDLSQSIEFVVRRDNPVLEGTRGVVGLGLPLWDLSERWGFEASAQWDVTVGRQLHGADLLTWDDPATQDTEAIPRIWEQNVYKLTIGGMRQLGGALKHRISFGYSALVTNYAPHADTGLTAAAASPILREDFQRDVLAPSREQLYPYVSWSAFTPKYLIYRELAAYAISEDVREGPWLRVFAAAPLEAFGSSRDAIVWDASAGFVWGPRACDGPACDRWLVDLYAGLSGRLEGGEAIDQTYRVRFRGATPRFFGRLVWNADLELRAADSAQALVTLGGDNGLRGYPSDSFYGFGADRVRVNLEWRTPPVVLGTVHIGGILFTDMGGVGAIASSAASLDFHATVGIGLRLFLPQFNRTVFRFDLGFPLDADRFTVLFGFGSAQAVPLTAFEDSRL